jgi:magnesium-protoporphyrin O-methyltransferase
VKTQELLDVILAEGVADATLLDVGAGVGAVHLALLEAGALRAIDVDASREYLAAAQAEAERRGVVERVDYRYGDLVELAPDLPSVDIVTADSVICCYPFVAALLDAMVAREPRLVGLTYAHDAWWHRAWMRASNLVWTIARKPDRWHIHRHAEVDRFMDGSDYEVIHDGGSWIWRVVVYRQRVVAA